MYKVKVVGKVVLTNPKADGPDRAIRHQWRCKFTTMPFVPLPGMYYRCDADDGDGDPIDRVVWVEKHGMFVVFIDPWGFDFDDATTVERDWKQLQEHAEGLGWWPLNPAAHYEPEKV